MYIVDDICYAETPMSEVRIVDAKPLVGGMLLVTYLSGEQRLFDTTSLEGAAFVPLRDESALQTVRAEHGFVSWLDGEIDLAPEYIFENSLPYVDTDDVLFVA